MPLDGSQLDDVTRLLIEGRQRIEDGGWTQKSYKSSVDSVCMLGAIEIGSSVAHVRKLDAVVRLAKAIGCPDTKYPSYEVVVWNDQPGRTHDEVLAAFDRAIAGQSGEGGR